MAISETSIEDRLRSIDEKGAGKPRKRVLVLGAGMAGLAAAYELEGRGHEVSIVERETERVGGRVWTHRFGDGTYGELGAMRIPIFHDYTRHYVGLLGLSLRKFVNHHEHGKGFYDLRGVVGRIEDASINHYPLFDLSSDQRKDPVAPAMFGRTLEDAVESLTDRERASLLSGTLHGDRLRRLDRMSLGEWLLERAGADASVLIGLSTGLEQFFDRGFTNFLRDALLEEGNRLDEIVGGMDLLPSELVKRLHSTKVHYGAQIVAIERDGQGRIAVAVRGKDGEQATLSGYDAVVCTLPFTALRHVSLGNLFSPEKLAAIRNLSYTSATKVLLHTRDRFWETKYGIFGGASVTDGLARQVYYPSDQAHAQTSSVPTVEKYASLYSGYRAGEFGSRFSGEEGGNDAPKDPGPGVLLGSYTWGEDARRLGALGREERRDAVVRSIARFHPEIHAAMHEGDEGHASMFWDEHEGMRGGTFSFLRPGDQQDHYENAIRPEGGVHFAGEHCSLFNGWIQGALVSALRAVEQIVEG